MGQIAMKSCWCEKGSVCSRVYLIPMAMPNAVECIKSDVIKQSYLKGK